MSDPSVAALCLMVTSHLVGDWIVQTDHQAAHKVDSWLAMHAHCIGYHSVMVALLWFVLGPTDLAVLVGVSYATHALIDRRWPVRWILEHTGSADFANLQWGVIATDQALHLSVLLVTLVAISQ